MIGLYTNLVRYLAQDDAARCGCDHTVTFDRAASRAAGMRLLEAGHA